MIKKVFVIASLATEFCRYCLIKVTLLVDLFYKYLKF